MRNSNFQELRIKLLNEVLKGEEFKVTEEFKKKFFKLIELCTFSMMQDKDNFFALFTVQMKREIRLDLPTAVANTASLSHFNIYFNPYIFLECSLEEMKALIKHEVYHIMFNHLKRARHIKGKFSNTAINRAMDVAINQYIIHLPAWSDTLQNVSMTYNVDLKRDKSMEEYAKIIQEGIDKLKSKVGKEIIDTEDKNEELIVKKHDVTHAHDIWSKSEDTLNFEQVEELTKKVASNAKRGKIPSEIFQIIEDLNKKPELAWKEYLQKIIGTLPAGYKKTITRRDRRQPDRLDIRGKLSNRIAQIVIAIDISGSITDSEIEQIMAEILGIVKNYSSNVTIIECDNEIRRVYNVKSKRDIRRKIDTKGGTLYTPVFKYMNKNQMRDHLLIYFTDGLGEEELKYPPSNCKILWVLTGKGKALSLKNPYGIVKRLSNVEVQEPEITYMKDAMKDILMEWQK